MATGLTDSEAKPWGGSFWGVSDPCDGWCWGGGLAVVLRWLIVNLSPFLAKWDIVVAGCAVCLGPSR